MNTEFNNIKQDDFKTIIPKIEKLENDTIKTLYNITSENKTLHDVSYQKYYIINKLTNCSINWDKYLNKYNNINLIEPIISMLVPIQLNGMNSYYTYKDLHNYKTKLNNCNILLEFCNVAINNSK